MPIRFFQEEIEFKLPEPSKVKKWLIRSVTNENKSIKDINYIFCSDSFLLRLNKEYLGHKTLTDIITFDESNDVGLAGEIYISIERVAENAHKYQVDFPFELRRVMIHGVLHLCGFKDKKAKEKMLMRKKEEAYLSLWEKLFHVKR